MSRTGRSSSIVPVLAAGVVLCVFGGLTEAKPAGNPPPAAAAVVAPAAASR